MADIICRPVKNQAECDTCFAIRRKVFVEEQGLFHETDRDEHDDAAVHIAAFCSDRIIGTVRVYPDRDDLWWGGRLAVLKGYRGKAGKLLVRAATEVVKQNRARSFRAYVQLENVAFFKTLGWTSVGKICEYHGKPHQLMEARLT